MNHYCLVTGGLGYVGSHVVLELLNKNYEVIIVDRQTDHKVTILNNIKKLTNKEIHFYSIDIKDKSELKNIFSNHRIDFVIHMATSKGIKESINDSFKFYHNNIASILILLEVMKEYDCHKLIFPSSTTVYGINKNPVHEDSIVGQNLINPYAKSKYFIEEILKDFQISNPTWSIVILRCFNPTGFHNSGLLNDDPKGFSHNLYSYLSKIKNGYMKQINILGNNHETFDGTCIRDYIHVEDVANAHVVSIKKLDETGTHIYNIGSGYGTSVLEFIHAFEKVNNIKINCVFGEKRDGDLACIYCDNSKALQELNWTIKHDLDSMVKVYEKI